MRYETIYERHDGSEITAIRHDTLDGGYFVWSVTNQRRLWPTVRQNVSLRAANALIADYESGDEDRRQFFAEMDLADMTNPCPATIRAAREAARLSQTAAAAMVHTTCRTWQQWEAGDRKMHPAFWELFRLKARPEERP